MRIIFDDNQYFDSKKLESERKSGEEAGCRTRNCSTFAVEYDLFSTIYQNVQKMGFVFEKLDGFFKKTPISVKVANYL